MTQDTPQTLAWRQLARAGDAVRAARNAEKPYQHDQLTGRIEDLLKTLAEKRTPDRDLLRQVIHSRSADLLAHVIDHHGAAIFRDIQSDPDRAITLHDTFIEGRIDLLTIFADNDIPVFHASPEPDILVTALATRAPGRSLLFAMRRGGLKAYFLSSRAHQFVVHCNADRAEAICAILSDLTPAERTTFWMNVAESQSTLFDIKSLAALLRSGLDANSLLSDMALSILPGQFLDLLSMTSSSHGRLALARQESSLQDILGRSAKTAEFFGYTQDAFEASFRRKWTS